MGGRYTASDNAVSGGWTVKTVRQKLQYDVVKGEKLQHDTVKGALTSPGEKQVIGKVITMPRSDTVTLPMPQIDQGGCFQGLAAIPNRVRSKSRLRFTVTGVPVAATGIPLPSRAKEEEEDPRRPRPRPPPPAAGLERPSDAPDEPQREVAEEDGGVWQWVVSTMQEIVGSTGTADGEEDYAVMRHLSTNVDSYTAPEWESDQEGATPEQDEAGKEEQDAATTKASESDEIRSQSESTQATATGPGEADTVSHDCGFLRLTHGPASMRIQVLSGEMLDADLLQALEIFGAFLEHPHSQDGFAIQYDLRQVSMPPMSFLSRIAEWGNEPSRSQRFQTMQTSCSVVLSAGWTFSIARGVLSTFFCCCPPACRTYLISDPDQDVSTAEVYFDPLPAQGKATLEATVTPGEGAHSEIAHGPSVAQVVSHALAEREAEALTPEEDKYRELELTDLMFQDYNHWHVRLPDSEVEKS